MQFLLLVVYLEEVVLAYLKHENITMVQCCLPHYSTLCYCHRLYLFNSFKTHTIVIFFCLLKKFYICLHICHLCCYSFPWHHGASVWKHFPPVQDIFTNNKPKQCLKWLAIYKRNGKTPSRSYLQILPVCIPSYPPSSWGIGRK